MLFTGAFATGCLVLWLVMTLYGYNWRSLNYHSLIQEAMYLPGISEFALNYRNALLLVPMPFIVHSIFSMFRKPLTSKRTGFYVGIMAFVFMILVLLVSAAILLPMVPFQPALLLDDKLDKSTNAQGMPGEKR